MPISSRPARAADVDAIRELAQTCFAHYTPRIGRRPMPMDLDYAEVVARGSTWVLEDGDTDGDTTSDTTSDTDTLLGFAVLVDASDHLLLDVLAVAPQAQGRGLGGQLLQLAEDQAARLGRPEVRLCTNEAMTENLRYYPRRGYVETSRVEVDGFRRVWFRKPVPG